MYDYPSEGSEVKERGVKERGGEGGDISYLPYISLHAASIVCALWAWLFIALN